MYAKLGAFTMYFSVMEWALLKYLMLILMVLLQIRGHRGCFEEERMGLLGFKTSLNSNGGDADYLLPSWVDDDGESNCCEWERVTCSATTGHVIHLSLYNVIQRAYEDLINYWLLDVSLFQHFIELRSLNLSSNGFDGWIQNKDLGGLSRLKKLETLDLSFNRFDKSVIRSLSALTSLKKLILARNFGDESFPAQELSVLENLETLDLSSCFISRSLTMKDVESLSRLKKLETLNLRHNLLSKSILPSLSVLTSLKNLFLSWNPIEGSFPAQELSVLKNLETLDLSTTLLDGSLTMQDLKSLSKLNKLRCLDLSGNRLNKEILRNLGALSSLKFLSLEDNAMEGVLSSQELANFTNLEVLILSNNYLNGTLPIQGLVTATNLEILDLSFNEFIGSIPPYISTLSSLKALNFCSNKLNGSLPIQGLCELKKLQKLDLSLNQFTGNISSAALASLISLEYIDLSHNSFEGSFSFSSFANHSKLEVVVFINDNDEFEVETELSSWVPMFQLKVLVLKNCKLNKLTGEIPKFLSNQYELRVVDLSDNDLKGRFPDWLLHNNTRLEFINLRSNSFMGEFRLSLYPNRNTYWMDVSGNKFGGQLQENIGQLVPYIEYLNLSGNTFEGSIPISICDMSRLDILDMSANKFSGEVPRKLVAGGCGLSELKLSNNSLHGQIFSENFNMTKILDLHLDNNQFTGTLTNVISRAQSLLMLDISNNYMSGEIGSGIGYMIQLRTLLMRNNSFKGLFPCELIPSAYLDLSHNFFSGSLSRCSGLRHLEHLHLQGNKITGSIPKAFFESSRLLTLDIRDNFLSGSIPNITGQLFELRVLLLGGNQLSGLIPYQFCQLNKIGLMDLSKNSFHGSIPSCFSDITFGRMRISDNVFAKPYDVFNRYVPGFYTYRSLLVRSSLYILRHIYDGQDEVEFVTKYIRSAYKGDIINYMSGLDLSCNKLTGEIPHELGNLSWIHALNLSHNQLTGYIPITFSNLTQIESLDLSYNNLSGEIPSTLIDLHFLAVFTVAHNNLSGRLPDMKAQFETFDNSSYDENPFLCGPPLEKSCTTIVESPHSRTASSEESEGKWYEIDPIVFFASFSASYIMFLLAVETLLYINPYWRQRWFNLIEECFYSCYYFVYDTLYKLLARFHN